MENIAVRVPVNKTAAMVVGKGFCFESKKKIQTQESDFPFPLVMDFEGEDITSKKTGRLTVIGLLDDGLSINNGLMNRKWVTKCVCGKYVIRRGRALLNPKNTQDRCERCRELAFLKREDVKRRTGKNVDINDF